MKYPELARFLAGHFGGYGSAEDAAAADYAGDTERYVEEFLEPMKGEGLDPEEVVQFEEQVAACERFLVAHPDHEALCEEHFDDAGNPKLSLTELEIIKPEAGLKFLCELVWQFN